GQVEDATARGDGALMVAVQVHLRAADVGADAQVAGLGGQVAAYGLAGVGIHGEAHARRGVAVTLEAGGVRTGLEVLVVQRRGTQVVAAYVDAGTLRAAVEGNGAGAAHGAEVGVDAG